MPTHRPDKLSGCFLWGGWVGSPPNSLSRDFPLLKLLLQGLLVTYLPMRPLG